MRSQENFEQRNERVFGCASPVAVVTGSTSPRVGKVICEHLEEQGFSVVKHAHRGPSVEGSAAVEAGGGVEAGDSQRDSHKQAPFTLSGSVDDEAVIIEWVRLVLEHKGQVDLLVNSAAIWETKALEDTQSRDFERAFRVNSLGTALTCKHFGLAMTKQASGGSIINIGDWAIARPYRDFSAYFPSKGCIAAITQSMAVELATRNPRVRVNSVLPGPVMLDASISAESAQKIVDECLLQRAGTPDDVAEAVLYLATSPFVTGVCLPVDGGRTIYAGPSADPIAHPQH